jgi:hypothetical protein
VANTFTISDELSVTAIDFKAADCAVTVTVGLVMPLMEALIWAVPLEATAVARPWVDAVLLIVTALLLSDAHVTEVVMSFVLLSLNVPLAVNCCVAPFGILVAADGLIAMDLRVAAGVDLPPPPQPETNASRVNPQTATASQIIDPTLELMASLLAFEAA